MNNVYGNIQTVGPKERHKKKKKIVQINTQLTTKTLTYHNEYK